MAARITTALLAITVATATGCAAGTADPGGDGDYPWHTDIVATTFWVGEIFDPFAPDGSQEMSAYDSNWLASYGGCDGVVVDGVCRTEPRSPDNGYFPKHMTPLENPFYLDLPFDDVNDEIAFAQRGTVVPWTDEDPYRDRVSDRAFSLMKNRWVRLRSGDRICYGQIQDAGPAQYHDAAYVFGDDDRRPVSTEFNGAGLDVSPALNGCLGFRELEGLNDRVDWQFVDEEEVPPGPWRTLVTTSGVRQ